MKFLALSKSLLFQPLLFSCYFCTSPKLVPFLCSPTGFPSITFPMVHLSPKLPPVLVVWKFSALHPALHPFLFLLRLFLLFSLWFGFLLCLPIHSSPSFLSSQLSYSLYPSLLSPAHFSLLFCAAASRLSLLAASGLHVVPSTYPSPIFHAQRKLKPQPQYPLFVVFAWDHTWFLCRTISEKSSVNLTSWYSDLRVIHSPQCGLDLMTPI